MLQFEWNAKTHLFCIQLLICFLSGQKEKATSNLRFAATLNRPAQNVC